MKKIWCYLAVITLLATLSGSLLQATGLGSLANATSSRHPSSPLVTEKAARPVAYTPSWPCPIVGIDC